MGIRRFSLLWVILLWGDKIVDVNIGQICGVQGWDTVQNLYLKLLSFAVFKKFNGLVFVSSLFIIIFLFHR